MARIREPFWVLSRDVFRYKRLLGLAALGAAISAACFGAGMGMVYPVVLLLLQRQQGLPGLIQTYMAPSRHHLVQVAGQWLITKVPTDPFLGVVAVLVGMMVLSLVGGIGRYIHTMSLYLILQRTSTRWRMLLVRRLINAPLAEALRSNSADRMSRVLNDTGQLAGGMGGIFGGGVTRVLNGLLAIAVALRINWKLSLVGMVGAPLLGLLMRYMGKRIRALSGSAVVRRGEVIGVLYEAVHNLRVVKSNQAEGFERRRFGRRNRELNRDEMKIRHIDAMSKPVIETLTMSGMAAVAIVAAYYVLRQGVPAAEFVTVLALLATAGGTMQRVLGLQNQVQECRPAAQRIFEGLALADEHDWSAAGVAAPALRRHGRSVTLESVSFTYPGQERPALRDISLTVPYGATVAIVGANGSGKTTLVSLLPRHFAPTAGRVLIDGTDIASIGLYSLRAQIAIVPQETVLFRAGVAENIAYGQPHAPRAKIVEAARIARADEFIGRLPQGYDTNLGDRGARLSGGERQRICIARAVLRDPAILILDEATSQIDADSEAKINQALRELRYGRTTFVIAHRLSTVIDADVILVLDHGRLVDRGTHDQLIKRCAAYRVLAQTQLRAEPVET